MLVQGRLSEDGAVWADEAVRKVVRRGVHFVGREIMVRRGARMTYARSEGWRW